MMVDEFYYHIKRGLPKWERLGHPLDTISVLACYVFILNSQPTIENVKWFVALSLFSCLLVTKDEFEHKKHCTAGEQWLHSVLFVIHPIILMVAGIIWYYADSYPELNLSLLTGLRIQTLITSLFLIYQITYWNIIWKQNQE